MTQKSNRRRNAIIAAVAGAALFLGGSTYALWSQTADLEGASIQAGNLNIVAGDIEVWDVSPDLGYVTPAAPGGLSVGKNGALIADPEAFRAVPGDAIIMAVPFTITMVGDNLVADLTMTVAEGDLLEANEFSSDLTVSLYTVIGGVSSDAKSLTELETSLYLGRYQAKAGTGGFILPGNTVIDGTKDGVLVVSVSFDHSATGDMNKILSIAEALQLSLQQVRGIT